METIIEEEEDRVLARRDASQKQLRGYSQSALAYAEELARVGHTERLTTARRELTEAIEKYNGESQCWKKLRELADQHTSTGCSKCRTSECCANLFPFCAFRDNACRRTSFFVTMASAAEYLMSRCGDVVLPSEFLEQCFPTLEMWHTVRHTWFPGMGETDRVSIYNFLLPILAAERVAEVSDISALEKRMATAMRQFMESRGAPAPYFMVPVLELTHRETSRWSCLKLLQMSFIVSIISPGSVRTSHPRVTRLPVADRQAPVEAFFGGTQTEGYRPPDEFFSAWSRRHDFIQILRDKDIAEMRNILSQEGTPLATNPELPYSDPMILERFTWLTEMSDRSYITREIWRDNLIPSEAVRRLSVLWTLCEEGALGTVHGCEELMTSALEHDIKLRSSTSKTAIEHIGRASYPNSRLIETRRASPFVNPSVHVHTSYSEKDAALVMETTARIVNEMVPMFRDDLVRGLEEVASSGGFRVNVGNCVFMNDINEFAAGHADIGDGSMNICYSASTSYGKAVIAHEFVHLTQTSFTRNNITVYAADTRPRVEVETFKKLVSSPKAHEVMRRTGRIYGLTNPLEMGAEYGTWLFELRQGRGYRKEELWIECLDIMQEYHETVYKVPFSEVRELVAARQARWSLLRSPVRAVSAFLHAMLD